MRKMNQRDLLIGVNPFWLSPRKQMYNCQKWSANSLKAGSAAPVGRYKVAPTGALAIDHGNIFSPDKQDRDRCNLSNILLCYTNVIYL